MKKFLCLFVFLASFALLFACDNNSGGSGKEDGGDDPKVVVPNLNISGNAVTTDEESTDYDKNNAAVYNANLGAFYDTYLKALEADSIAERYALMAVAEAKLYESGAFLPTTTQGGNYAISRVVPRSVTTVLWGNDSDRLGTALVVKGNPLTAAQRNELRAIWNEESGKGNGEYLAKAKEYLAKNGLELDDTYKYAFTSDPETFDVLSSSKAVDAEVLVNTYDGLLQYDVENTQRGALAESYEVSDDGLTYTFHIRQGVKWVDVQGRDVAEVKADDWVAGLQHMTDADAGLDWLIDGIVKGYGAYVARQDMDFSHVGIKAVDDYTLVIELEHECSYFPTMLGYSCFAPLCRSYYESKGGKFGADFVDDDTYTYGKGNDSIVYCGPFIVTSYASENEIVFEKNEKYWNAENITLNKIVWTYNDGTDVLKAYDDMKAGDLAGCGLNTSAVVKAKEDGMFDKYSYTSDTNATAFCGFFNLAREGYANFNNAAVAVSPKTEAQKADTKVALSNVYFRLAIAFAFDRGTWNGLSVGTELKYNSLTNGYTPGNFVKLPEAATIKINGKNVSYKAGTLYGEIVQDQLDADGVHIKYFDRELGVSSGFDGWYNPNNAAAYLDKAAKELAAQGVEVSASHPIYIDYPYRAHSEISTNQSNAFKQSVERALGGRVIINLVATNTNAEYNATGYSTKYGYQANYDLYTGSGWGPDYGDPSSYLDTMLPEYAGYMTKTLGIY